MTPGLGLLAKQAAVSGQRFVLDHLAKPPIQSGSWQPWEAGIRELAQFPSVFCKLSGLVTEADWKSWNREQMAPYLDVALDCFGPDRLMIGSDWPVCTVAASYSETMNIVLDYLSKYPDEVRDSILGGTATVLEVKGSATNQVSIVKRSLHTIH